MFHNISIWVHQGECFLIGILSPLAGQGNERPSVSLPPPISPTGTLLLTDIALHSMQ
jgi:hypothetical protein